MKLKEPKKLIAAILVIYIIMMGLIAIKNFSKQNEVPVITGLTSNGVVFINIVSAVNITACIPPAKPRINPVSDTYDNSEITLSWAASKNSTEYDEFTFNSESPVAAKSPQIKKYLKYGTYAWKVRTCNNACCSSYDTDSFEIKRRIYAPVTIAKEIVSKAVAAPVIEKPEVQIPKVPKLPSIIYGFVIKFFEVGMYLIVLVITIILFLIILKKHDEENKKQQREIKLKRHIEEAVKKGFKNEQIKEKLLESGFAEAEIDHVFNQIKTK